MQAQLIAASAAASCSLLWQSLACHPGQSCLLQAPPPLLGSTQAVPASTQGTRAVQASTQGEGSSPADETQHEGFHWVQQQRPKQSSERLGVQRPASHGGVGAPGPFGGGPLPLEMQAALQHHQHQQLMGQMLLGSMGLPGMAPPGMGVHPGMAQLAVGGMGGMGMPYPGFPAPYGPYGMGGFGNPYAVQPGPGSMPGAGSMPSPPMGPPMPPCAHPPGLDPMTAWYMHHYGRFMAAAHHHQQQTQSGQGAGTSGEACMCTSVCCTTTSRRCGGTAGEPAGPCAGCSSTGWQTRAQGRRATGCILLPGPFALPSCLPSWSACTHRAVQQRGQ